MTRISGLLGLCCRAGQAVLGAEMALEEIRSGKIGLVLLDEAASEGTRKKLLDACAFRSIPSHTLPSGELSRACGKDGRMAAAIRKGTLCGRMIQLLEEKTVPGQNS